jgi:MHS family citrate/tricarballylate:H+ symporter-like MFS transporter
MTDTIASDAAVEEQLRPSVSLRQIAAVVAGNALEFYDFLTFSFFSVQISHTFFPQQDEDTKLLLTLAIFGVGFVTRPIGAFVIGRWGDRAGRKPAMMFSFALMGIAITGLALTPSRAAIGIAAPILFLCFRLLQGFALGGEVGPTTAYLLEAAPPLKRGFYASLQFATQDLAVLAAGIVGVVLSNLLDGPALDAWGWRIAFLIGAAVIPFGLMVRHGLPETLGKARDTAQSPARVPPGVWRLAALGIVMLASGTITNYVIVYMTTFAENTLHIAARIAFWATVASGLSGMCFDLVSGFLSDRLGRKPVMLVSGVVYLCAIFPAFYAIIHLKSVAALLIGCALLQGLQGLYGGPILIGITEGLPRHIRSGGLSIIYALAISSFGGTTQFIVKGLIELTGSRYAPAGFMTFALSFAVVAMLFVRETAPVKTGNAFDR